MSTFNPTAEYTSLSFDTNSYMYGANRWERDFRRIAHATNVVYYIAYARTYVKQLQPPVVYAAYTVHIRRSTRLSSRVSHVTFPTVVTVSIVRGSILFVLMNSW